MARALALALAWGALLLSAGPGSAAEPIRIATLPVVVHALEDSAYLRGGIGDMLAARLGRDAALQVVPVRDLARATTDLAEARATARALGAEYVLFGSFTRFGEGASLDVQCARVEPGGADDASEDGRAVFIHAGSLERLIPELEPLADRIAHYVTTGDGGDPARARPARAARAGSRRSDELLRTALAELSALRERVQALEELRAATESASR